MSEPGKRVSEKWNRQAASPTVRKNYWQFPEICAHINMKICGLPMDGIAHGMHRRMKELGPFKYGVSVGCGRATKETSLLRSGIVERIDCFDLAEARLAEARNRMERIGVVDRARLICGNAFETMPTETYDLVYWHSSLHHMMDVFAAVRWSWQVLKPGGVFVMREYTGPSRWQWTDRNLQFINRFRVALPQRLRPRKVELERPTIESMIKRDPSEAADSENILPAVVETFPDAEIIPLGGALYSFALRGIAPKLEPQDTWFFDILMTLDDALMDESLVTFALAAKPSETAGP